MSCLLGCVAKWLFLLQVMRQVIPKDLFHELLTLIAKDSSRPEVFCKKMFLIIAKKRLQQRCFSVNFAKFLKTPFFTKYLWWLLLFLSVNDTCKVYEWKLIFDYRIHEKNSSHWPKRKMTKMFNMEDVCFSKHDWQSTLSIHIYYYYHYHYHY